MTTTDRPSPKWLEELLEHPEKITNPMPELAILLLNEIRALRKRIKHLEKFAPQSMGK